MPDGDKDTYNYFLDLSCVMISSFDFFKKMFNLVGEGNNGKSVYVKLMEQLAGRLGATLSDDIVRCGKKATAGSHSAHLCALIGKVVGIYGEATDEPLNQGLIKMMSGDDKISMREAYGKKNFSTKLNCTIVISGNTVFSIQWEEATIKRQEYIYFGNRFSLKPNPKKKTDKKQDSELIKKFEHIPYYRNQLFTLIMKRAPNLYKTRCLKRSKYIQSVFDRYVNQVDTTTEFCNNLKPITPEDKHKGIKPFNASQIHKIYLKWCEDNVKGKEKLGVFTKKLKKICPPREKKITQCNSV